MATPTYKGQGQPAATSGGWLGSWFGDPTPAYLGATATSGTANGATANPSTRRRSLFAFAAPAYKVAPAVADDDCDMSAPAEIAIVIPRQAMDPQT